MPQRNLSRVGFVAAWGLCAMTTVGCGYKTGSMHPADIHTVYVPIFKSQEFRRDLEFALTEAVVKEIELVTPYKVVKREQADTELLGTLVSVEKRVATINPDSDPRELVLRLKADVTWRDIRSGQSLVGGKGRGGSREVVETVTYVPELGHSITSASNRGIRRMARRIVELMEQPW
jgi:lipopolysaccharide assembly LptE-like protein